MSETNPLQQLRAYLEGVIVGQRALLDRLLISLLTGGHLLVDGLPGLAKTTAIKTLAEGVHASLQRIQFTPDLLPSASLGPFRQRARGRHRQWRDDRPRAGRRA